jgi:hypothetical protein
VLRSVRFCCTDPDPGKDCIQEGGPFMVTLAVINKLTETTKSLAELLRQLQHPDSYL